MTRKRKEKNYSGYIDKVVDYLKLMGCEVVFDIDFNQKLLGNCNYRKKRITIGDVPKAKTALMVLLHECGHWISYIDYREKMKAHWKLQDKPFLRAQKLREVWAKKFAIQTIKRLQIPITTRQYEKFENA